MISQNKFILQSFIQKPIGNYIADFRIDGKFIVEKEKIRANP